MTEDKRKKLEELGAELEDLKRRNPAHCSGKSTFVGHQMTPELYEKIEDLEEEIKTLKAELDEA